MTRYLFQKPRISSGYYSGTVSYDRDGRLVADSTRHIAAVEYEAWGGLLPRTVDMGAKYLTPINSPSHVTDCHVFH